MKKIGLLVASLLSLFLVAFLFQSKKCKWEIKCCHYILPSL